jgi:hypothetical protein
VNCAWRGLMIRQRNSAVEAHLQAGRGSESIIHAAAVEVLPRSVVLDRDAAPLPARPGRHSLGWRLDNPRCPDPGAPRGWDRRAEGCRQCVQPSRLFSFRAPPTGGLRHGKRVDVRSQCNDGTMRWITERYPPFQRHIIVLFSPTRTKLPHRPQSPWDGRTFPQLLLSSTALVIASHADMKAMLAMTSLG